MHKPYKFHCQYSHDIFITHITQLSNMVANTLLWKDGKAKKALMKLRRNNEAHLHSKEAYFTRQEVKAE